jgi:DNA repair protein RadC
MGTILYTTDPNATTGFREATFEELIAGARHALAIRVRKGAVMASPNAARDYLTMRLPPRDHEVFCCLFLDNRHRVICFEEVFRGTIDGASVHPREIVKLALARNAAAVILAHNHPSGVAEPSQADELITARLREALGLVDIRVLDHFVVGDVQCVSFAERGLL